MRIAFFAIAAAVVMSGCASTKWTRPGGTGEALADDQLKCEALSSMRCARSYGLYATICENNAYFGCMEMRGWKKE